MNRSILSVAVLLGMLFNLPTARAQRTRNLYFNLSSTTQLPTGAIVTLNHWGKGTGKAELTFRVYRIEDPASFFFAGGSPQNFDYLGLLNSGALASKTFPQVATWTHRITMNGESATESIPLSLTTPGAYIVEASTNERRALVAVIVSRLVLTVEAREREAIVYVVDRVSGRKMPDVEVTLMIDSQKVASGRTDAEGVLHMAIPAMVGEKPRDLVNEWDETFKTLFAYGERDQHIAMEEIAYRYSTNNRLPYRLFLSTDRPAYRPGDTIYYRGIMRRGNERGEFVPAEGDRVDISFLAPRQSRSPDPRSTTVSADGTFSGAVNSTSLGAGTYTGTIRIEPARSRTGITPAAIIPKESERFEFVVADSPRPPFTMVVTTDRAYYAPGDTITTTVRVTAPSGSPLPDVTGYYVTRGELYQPTWVLDSTWNHFQRERYREEYFDRDGDSEKRLRSDAEGMISFRQRASPANRYRQSIRINLQDPHQPDRWVQRTFTVLVTTASVQLTVQPERYIYRAGERIDILVHAIDPGSRKPVEAPFKVYLTRVSSSTNRPAQGVIAWSGEGRTGADGIGSISTSVAQGGYLALSVEEVGGGQNVTVSPTAITVADPNVTEWGMPSSSDIYLETGPTLLRTTDTISALIILPDTTSDPLVYVMTPTSLSQNMIPVMTRVERLGGGLALVRLPVEQRFGSNFYLVTRTIAGNSSHVATRQFSVVPAAKAIDISVRPEKERYSPGEEASVVLHATGQDGQPLANALISLSVVDEAVYALGRPHDRSTMIGTLSAPGNDSYLTAAYSSLDYSLSGPMAKKSQGKWVIDDAVGISSDLEGWGDGIGISREEEIRKPTVNYNLDGLDAPILPTSNATQTPERLLWMPSIRTDTEGNARVSFSLPAYPAVWRVTAQGTTTTGGAGENVIRIRVE